MTDKKETKKTLKKQRSDAIQTPTRKIYYQVDTLNQVSANNTIAYFTPSANTLTINHHLSENSPLAKSKAIKAHEQKHSDNHAAGLDNLPMSLEQHYKMNMHNEISATMAELLHIRQEYVNAPTPEDRKKILARADAQKFYYYTNALKEGKLNPLTQNAAEFEKEMKFIATETQAFWMENFAAHYDKHQTCDNTLLYFYAHDYDELKDNPQNYAAARRSAYTIGGIDFSQYVDDIPCINKNIPQADKLLTANKLRDEIRKSIIPTENSDDGLIFAYDYYRYQTVSLAQRAELEALSHIALNLENLMSIRKQWLKCETDKERADLMKNLDVNDTLTEAWLKAANEGKIHPQRLIIPKEEQHFLGALIKKETTKQSDIALYDIKNYIETMGEKQIKSAIQTGEADKNYQKSLKKMFTHFGTDFSSYVNKPDMDLSLLATAEQKIKTNKKVNIDLDLQEKEEHSYLAVPEITPNPNLSMEQQLRLAQHKMFVENALLHNNEFRQQLKKDAELEKDNKTFLETTYTFENPNTDLTLNSQPEIILVPFQPYENIYKEERLKQIISPYDKTSNSMEYNLKGIHTDYTFKMLQIDLKYNSELQEKWQKAEKILASQIAENYKDAIILPKANEALYQQELNKIYTIEGFNLKDELKKQFGKQKNIEENIATIKSPEIEEVQSTTILSRAKTKARNTYYEVKNTALKKTEEVKSWATKKTKETTDWLTNKWNAFTNLLPNKKSPPTDYRKKKISPPIATTPQYKVWSPQQRVSPVLQEEIYDMTSPFLKQQQELLAQNKLKTEKLNRKLKNKEKTQTVRTKKNISKNTTTQSATKTAAVSQHEHN